MHFWDVRCSKCGHKRLNHNADGCNYLHKHKSAGKLLFECPCKGFEQ